MKAPKYIPLWFHKRIDDMAFENTFGYKGASIQSRNAFHRLCWRVYWQGKQAVWAENAAKKLQGMTNSRFRRL